MISITPFLIYFQQVGERFSCVLSLIVSPLVTASGAPSATDTGLAAADLRLLGGRAGDANQPIAPTVHRLPSTSAR